MIMTSTFPNHLPADRRYIHGSWPISRHRFMSNREQRMLHATAKTGQELRLTFANRTPEIIQHYFDHYNEAYGTQYAFTIPPRVFTGWAPSADLLGKNLLWQYKEPPRIRSQRGRFGTLEVTLTTATTGGLSGTDGCTPITGLPAGKAPGFGGGSFPAHHPSNRNITFGDWNSKRFNGGLSRQAVTIALPRTAVDSDAKLSLTFANRADAVAEEILAHYDSYTSTLNTFNLSAEILEDWDAPLQVNWRTSLWIYDAAPQVTTTHIGTSTTNVRLALVR